MAAVAMDQFAPFNEGPGADVTESMWRDMLGHLRDDGVIATSTYPADPDELEVYADSTGMQIKVRPGEVWIRGHWGAISGEKVLPITEADGTNPRLDRVVARADFQLNKIVLEVVTGTPSTSPVAPALTQSSTMWEIPLAQVTVAAGVVTVAAGDVTDERRRVGTGLFNHWAPPLYYEGSLNSYSDNPLDLGAGSSAYCRWFQLGKLLIVRYDFRWGDPPYDGGTGRIYTELPPDLRSALNSPSRISSHLWTSSQGDMDWVGTAMIREDDYRVLPMFSLSGTQATIGWYVIDDHSAPGPGSGTPSITDGYPQGGSLVISGSLEVQ